ncbi:Adenylyl cyclase-associated protein [Aphelenchoides besseyi]|nr:Adenylyl cyclase-associated protein [Aphelenchoides besseyi]
MSTQQLESLVKRIEDATIRLETICNQKPALPPKPTNTSGSNISVTSSGQTPQSVKLYDEQVEEPLRAFLTICKSIGGDVSIMGEKVKVVFELLRNHIWFAAGQKAPTEDVLNKKLEPMIKLMQEIGELKESRRNTPFFNHLSAIAEGIPAISWINITPTPAPFIKEMLDASMFFVNRVRTEHKNDQTHTDWTKGWCEVMNSLQKALHPPANSAISGGITAPTDSAKRAGGNVPLPPPPPPADFFKDTKPKVQSNEDAEASAKQALMADINKGLEITSRLKKVTADMQTHKNPSLRGQSTVPSHAGSGAKTTVAGANATKPVVEKPPKTELQDGKTWIVVFEEKEYHKGNREILIQVADMKQSVYVFRCENSIIQVKGKVNSITLDGCKKTGIVVDSLLSQVEVINSQSIKVETKGAMPTISIQKTDGCQVFLSKECLDAEIVTSKSSEMNICIPKDDGDYIEIAVPEQFKTVFNPSTNKLDTTVSDIV